MRVEHVAWQVPEPVAFCEWYVAELGCRVVRQMDQAPWTSFMVGPGDGVMIEVYRNDAAPVPEYAGQDPLVLHLAFAVDDVAAERDRLVAAGASVETDAQVIPTGDTICMLRDPWGFAIQLVHRANPMI